MKLNVPLTPLVPAFAVFTTMAPLDDDVDSPDERLIAPPLNEELLPADMTIPDAEDVPELIPADNIIAPLDPPVDEPLCIVMEPDDPDEVVPEINDKAPDTPAVPALGVNTTMLPLDAATPWPLDVLMLPPVTEVD